MQLKLLIVLFVFFCFSCQEPQVSQSTIVSNSNNKIKEAKRFALIETEKYKLLYLFGKRQNFDTTSKFVLANDTNGLRESYPNYQLIKTPIQSIAALSSIYAAMLDTLGALSALTAIDNIEYTSNKQIINKFKSNHLIELAKAPQIDIEKTIHLQPQLIITFGMGEVEKDIEPKLKLTKIPVAVVVDHLETTPLARAEWIKLVAAFVNKDDWADSIYTATANNYQRLKLLLVNNHFKPSVFSETKFGDVWYTPGGKSFMATLIKDAGANYLWADNQEAGSIPLSFEQVYAKAKQADFWIHLSTYQNKQQLLQNESRYAAFAAFESGQLYNNNKYTNAYGYTNYWETAMIYPDRILSDLIQIFHPEIKMEPKLNLYYYKKLN